MQFKKELEASSISSVFVGELEDALQACDWNSVDKLMPSIYYVSDRSRSIIDTIADLGLQNIDSNIVMIFHLLRAFNFKQKKSHVWTYASLLLNKIKTILYQNLVIGKIAYLKIFLKILQLKRTLKN